MMRSSHNKKRLLIWIALFAFALITLSLGLVSYRQWRESTISTVTLHIAGTSDVSTSAILVRSPLAIEKVLRRPEVRELKIIQNQQAPANWLRQVLWVDANHHTRELRLRIETTDADNHEQRVILSAIEEVLREVTARSSGKTPDQEAGSQVR